MRSLMVVRLAADLDDIDAKIRESIWYGKPGLFLQIDPQVRIFPELKRVGGPEATPSDL